jgi:hypothetical protein
MRRNKKTQTDPSSGVPEEVEASARTNKTHVPKDHIRKRAYEIHRAHGGGSGKELDDWLQAEREIKAEMDQASDAQG